MYSSPNGLVMFRVSFIDGADEKFNVIVWLIILAILAFWIGDVIVIVGDSIFS